ncbi:MAG TPA: [FeFe] hydrogenase H-cluster radical SAM maturase HydE [Bacteroidales bacterium]|nr:[FeFe] hydrogenase H-cluster radical SAM maturase HydE [Bacteroidales bacterium]HRZ48851.1 [FeFe] hydrogenase H-cluster radical SAM maturase HydE [Bacteroidales bacterium]
MPNIIDELLNKESFTREDLIILLQADAVQRQQIYTKAAAIKEEYVGKKVYFRGLIEFSNICAKNCYYCGIRRGNKKVERYYLTEQEVVDAALYAWKEQYASLVIQAGERSDHTHTRNITSLLRRIHHETNGEMHITLSLGEQSEETLREWFDAGAHRYLLRIEETDQALYRKLHPNDKTHDFTTRLNCLYTLRKIGYQVGTGVMIGLPFQTIENLADDLIFFRDIDIDMAGMGPYIEHEDTPLWEYRDLLLPREERFNLTMKMIALLRIMMKDINIAATTAMQAIDPVGREKALKVGANVTMPNLTPVKYREGYLLYEDKPCVDEEADECKNCLEARIKLSGDDIGYGEWGDSVHFRGRRK